MQLNAQTIINTRESAVTNFYQETLGACYANSIKILQRKVTNHYNKILKPTGLTSSQVTMLLGIGGKPGIITSELSALLSHDLSATQRGAQALEEKGYIKIESGKQRSRKLFLTKKAEKKLEEVTPLWIEAQETVHDIIPDKPSSQLKSLLK